MKKLAVLFLASAAILPLRAENLLGNPGFEESKQVPWQTWPQQSSRSTENPASGKMCMAVPALKDKGEYLLHKNIPAEPGYAYICKLKTRSDDCKRALEVVLLFRDKKGNVVNTAKVITRSATKDWVESQGAGLASEKAATVDLSIEVPPGTGTFYVDDVSLEQGSRIIGTAGSGKLERVKGGLQIVTPSCTMEFIENRNFGLSGIKFKNGQRLQHFTLGVPVQGKDQQSKSFYIVNRNIVTNLEAELRDDGLFFAVEERFPLVKARRIVECYEGASYIKMTCELEALEDFKSSQAVMNFTFTAGLIAQGRDPKVKYKKWTKANDWFNLDRPDDPRLLSFLDAEGKNGIALIGPDKTSWEELPGRLLSSSSGKETAPCFGTGLVKWRGAEIRKGDKVSFEVFLAPVENHDKAVELAGKLCPAD